MPVPQAYSMADLSRTESYQYPSAHYGHLSDNQQKELDAFKLLSQQEGYYTPAGVTSVEASHDDETLMYVAAWAQASLRGTTALRIVSM